jgi:aryl-alcohol dehydrogenase-like predicted oxidoreductase
MAARIMNDRNFAIVQQLEEFAGARGHTILDVAFGWLLTKGYVGSVIAGATKPEQVAANVAAGSGWRLTPDEMAEVDKITK